MNTEKKRPIIAIAGNPNSGKTTLFNALTGSNQRVGNWPGVTVEKKVGQTTFGSTSVDIVDLPGIYSLSSHSEDERVSRDYLLSNEADFVINIVDASNLERNLFLTLNILEMKVPTVIVLTMTDLALNKGLTVDPQKISNALGIPVFAANVTQKNEVASLSRALNDVIDTIKPNDFKVSYSAPVENALEKIIENVQSVATKINCDPRWVAIKVLEEDAHLTKQVLESNPSFEKELQDILNKIEKDSGDSADAEIASNKYDVISSISRSSVTGGVKKTSFGEKLDRIVLNRFLGIPIFLGVMYLMFTLVINVGDIFIGFFEDFFGAIFVDGLGLLLETIGSPDWLTALLAGGIGAGIQTVASFVPIMFLMFFFLSLLEDSGYMSRAAFVMDRALRAIGLPGKAFIPMIVGFGCTVPAIMATRTLENKRDRYLTVFMAPFMSCGARLPVYALFGAAFFKERAGLIVLSIYLVGILLAVLTGLILKTTLFKGEPAPFVMELPPYHAPRFANIFRFSWMRLKTFLLRAGKVIIIVVALLGVLNSVGTDGSFGNEDSTNSVLSVVGKSLTPIFKPMGITEENWPATVGMFTGIFAKEAVVGTLNGLYGQMYALEISQAGLLLEDEQDEEEAYNFGEAILDSFKVIPSKIIELTDVILDPFGFSIIGDDEEAIAEEIEADLGIFDIVRDRFAHNKHAAYAYMLFILIYFPCVAALAAILREIGTFYGVLCVIYLTVLAWITATLYYQIAFAHQAIWIIIPIVLFALIILAFELIRRNEKLRVNA